ncbi:hypothetical protein U9M48_010775 [Paspalum notatum var. saurae]|uniref:Uncharacterized protein n=1 Tax=Paspalum notatum var. saurae TaxID=547442 RepID=A0AAQ3STQ5_PASNO
MQCLAKPRAVEPIPLLAVHLQSMAYVDVKMRWKKDTSFDAVPVLSHARDIRPLTSLVRILSPCPTPVSAVSKLGRILEIPDRRVTSFLRRCPAAFVESVGPQHNLPWFRLSEAAAHLLQEERDVFAARRADVTGRLRLLLLMCQHRRLPLRVAQGMLWHLGIPEDYFKCPDHDIAQDGFKIIISGDGVISQDDNHHGRELGLIDDGNDQETPLSVLQMNAKRKYGSLAEVPVPLFQSKGLRLKRKVKDWLEGFQSLPYVSPYEDFSHINPGTAVSEKRSVGVLHELLSLFVICSAERRRLLCLRQHLGLPQKFHLVFERHPHVFYLLLKEKTCFVVLKEAYMSGGDTAIKEHPMLEVRKKYVELMEQSREIIRCRRSGKPIGLESEKNASRAETGYSHGTASPTTAPARTVFPFDFPAPAPQKPQTPPATALLDLSTMSFAEGDDDEAFLLALDAAEATALDTSKRRRLSTTSSSPTPATPPAASEGSYLAALKGSHSSAWQQQQALSYTHKRPDGSKTLSAGTGSGGTQVASGACFKCGDPNHWARECPQSAPNTGGGGPFGGGSGGGYGNAGVEVEEKACPCGAGSCLVLTSNTPRNPGRKFYKCPMRDNGGCNFFEWCDAPSPAPANARSNTVFQSETSAVGMLCPCGAGTCLVLTTKTGKNVGRQFYRCPANQWCDEQQPRVGAPLQASPQYQADAMSTIQNSSKRSSAACFKCGQDDHWARDCPNQSLDPYPDKGGRTITSGSSPCFKCGRAGHWSRDCPTSNSGGGGTGASRAKSSSALGSWNSQRY